MIKSFLAGDTVEWGYCDSDYPASDGWSMKYILLKDGSAIEINSVADGDDHIVTIPAATSAAYDPGEYSITQFAVKTDERYTLDSGIVTILPDPTASPDGSDTRSWTKKALDDVRAVIQKRASQSVLERDVDGIKLRYYKLEDLLALETTLLNRYNEEQGITNLPLTILYTTRGYQ